MKDIVIHEHIDLNSTDRDPSSCSTDTCSTELSIYKKKSTWVVVAALFGAGVGIGVFKDLVIYALS
jgi:hypothetical protein